MKILLRTWYRSAPALVFSALTFSGWVVAFPTFAQVSLVFAGWVASTPAFAQISAISSDKVVFPAGLKWERMRTVILEPATQGSPPMVSVRPEDVTAVKRIWSDEVKKYTERGDAPSFNSQISTLNYKGVPIAISLISLPTDYDRCEQALNGKNVVDVYEKCLARIAIGSAQKPHVVEFSGFCYADSVWATPEELRFRAQTQNQLAFDDKTGTVYFRLLQHGRYVPTCNRMIKIGGVSK